MTSIGKLCGSQEARFQLKICLFCGAFAGLVVTIFSILSGIPIFSLVIGLGVTPIIGLFFGLRYHTLKLGGVRKSLAFGLIAAMCFGLSYYAVSSLILILAAVLN